MNMQEIKALCKKYNLPCGGKKGFILSQIKQFLKTGRTPKIKALPAISKAIPRQKYPLHKDAYILQGAYKNDLATRNFFKNLIGQHFHFTAFGQDWILQRWQVGKPPTYTEFAEFWQKEFLKRKNSVARPKEEWAYLNFVQKSVKANPKISRQTIARKWEKIRKAKVKQVKNILAKIKLSKTTL